MPAGRGTPATANKDHPVVPMYLQKYSTEELAVFTTLACGYLLSHPSSSPNVTAKETYSLLAKADGHDAVRSLSVSPVGELERDCVLQVVCMACCMLGHGTFLPITDGLPYSGDY